MVDRLDAWEQGTRRTVVPAREEHAKAAACKLYVRLKLLRFCLHGLDACLRQIATRVLARRVEIDRSSTDV